MLAVNSTKSLNALYINKKECVSYDQSFRALLLLPVGCSEECPWSAGHYSTHRAHGRCPSHLTCFSVWCEAHCNYASGKRNNW